MSVRSLVIITTLALAGCQSANTAKPHNQLRTQASPPSTSQVEKQASPISYSGTTDLKELTSHNWSVDETGTAARQCTLKFSLGTQNEDEPASPSRSTPSGSTQITGCKNAELAKIKSWSIAGNTIELLGSENTKIAFLLMERPDLLLGYTASGHDLVVSQL
ncbi:hypothetical protein [Flexibacterium corallicola]|uniref:hypothetical protein n=1 Tax=Flexibacterium corallicola TaxID=3037259 RepID=UPI00286F5C18|nr:hypothetical protein [Pseudovibrio sp. M1P-2-3]